MNWVIIDEKDHQVRKLVMKYEISLNVCLYFFCLCFILITDNQSKGITNIFLNQSDPTLPYSVIKSEYDRRFKEPELSPRRGLLRRSTSLHLIGQYELT